MHLIVHTSAWTQPFWPLLSTAHFRSTAGLFTSHLSSPRMHDTLHFPSLHTSPAAQGRMLDQSVHTSVSNSPQTLYPFPSQTTSPVAQSLVQPGVVAEHSPLEQP